VNWTGDIDLVADGDAHAFKRELFAAAEQLGFTAVLDAPRIVNTIEVDLLFPGSRSRTVVFVDSGGRVLHWDVVMTRNPVPTDAAATDLAMLERDLRTAYLVLKRLRKRDERPSAWTAIGPISPATRRILSDVLDPPLGRVLTEAVNSGQAPSRSTIARAVRRMRWRRALSASAPAALISASKAAVGRTLHPAGIFVSLGGVDGSGKSAVTDALVEWSPFRRAFRIHSRPGVLKPMGWYVGRSEGDGSDPHGKGPWPQPMSGIRLFYFWLDFVAGYWIRIWPVRARGGLVVSERWWWDMYVDPRRHRLEAMPRSTRLLARLIPRTDVFFLLDAPSERIHERKRELSATEIERQRTAWSEIAGDVPGLTHIDAAQPLDVVTGEVVARVTTNQRARLGDEGQLRSFPPGDARWIIDTSSPSSLRDAMRLYQPSRRSAKAISKVTSTAMRWRLIGRHALTRLTGEVGPAERAAIDWIRSSAESELGAAQGLSVSAYLGAPGPKQKLSAVVVDTDGTPRAFAKLATTAAAIRSLRNESQALERASGLAPSVSVPRILSMEEGVESLLLLLAPVAGERMKDTAALDHRHIRLTSELARSAEAFDASAHIEQLNARLHETDHPRSETLQRVLEALPGISASAGTQFFAHGDLTPWNCLECHGLLGVVDWEMAGFRPPGWDLVHYVTQVESIVGQADPDVAAHRVATSPALASAGPPTLALLDATDDPGSTWRSLRALALTESALELIEQQPELSGRGIEIRARAAAELTGVAQHLFPK
jgi:thymidylate kinase